MREIIVEKMYIDDMEENIKYMKYLSTISNIKLLSVLSCDKFQYIINENIQDNFICFLQLFDNKTLKSAMRSSSDRCINMTYAPQIKKHVIYVSFASIKSIHKFLKQQHVCEIIFDFFKQMIVEIKNTSDEGKILDVLNAGSEIIVTKLN